MLILACYVSFMRQCEHARITKQMLQDRADAVEIIMQMFGIPLEPFAVISVLEAQALQSQLPQPLLPSSLLTLRTAAGDGLGIMVPMRVIQRGYAYDRPQPEDCQVFSNGPVFATLEEHRPAADSLFSLQSSQRPTVLGGETALVLFQPKKEPAASKLDTKIDVQIATAKVALVCYPTTLGPMLPRRVR